MTEESEEKKEDKKEPIRPIILVPDVDKDGHSVFICLSKDDEEFVKTALINPPGLKIKSAEGQTCPIDGKEYEKSLCKKLNEPFGKRKKNKRKSNVACSACETE